MVDWSQCPGVESDPERVHGAWVFRNTRLPISIVFECLAKGATIDDIVQWYGGVTREQIEQVVKFVADSLPEDKDAFFYPHMPSILFVDDLNELNQIESHYWQGMAYLGLGQASEAKGYFEKVLELDPSHQNAWEEYKRLG